jgi:hypothetical protein
MKMTRLAATVIAGALLAGEAKAQVNIYLTGAVAFRSQTYSIITTNLFGPNLVSQNPTNNGSSASVITWSGTIPSLFGGQTVNVYANYNGAVAGIQNLTLNTPASFLVTAPGDTNRFSAVADLAFSSVFQKSTTYTTPVLNDEIFGVTPLFWLKSTNWPAGFTNITSQQIKELASNGYLPAWYFTGNTNDTQYVYFVTRDVTAGQRVITSKDSGFSGSPAAYANNGTTWVYDPTGQTSTANIINQLNKYGPSISYLTGVDAINATNATILTYNGVSPFKDTTTLSSTSNNFAPVINGQYTLWGYEHILSRTTASGNVATFLSALSTNLVTSLNTYAYSIPKANVQVKRDSDGGKVYPN